MCGIAGIADFASRGIDPSVLEHASDTMRHRGPDDAGIWIDEQPGLFVGLAAARLAVIDPSPAGHQPMLYGGGRYAIVFNGILYNHRELRDELAGGGAAFETRCDTEVVLAACARWGVEALPRFNGMWALAFYDRRDRRGFLARDRFGIKPLFWVQHGERFAFASELRTLIGLGDWPRGVDHAALTHYLRFGYVAHPDTIYEHARRLEPATFLPFNDAGVGEPVRYYHVPIRGNGAAPVDRVEAGRRVRRALFESVTRRRVADVPIGAFLSGGLDSSIVVAHLAEVSGEPIQTFAVGWADADAYDETRYARCVADRFGTDHHELKCTLADVVSILPAMLDHQAEPFFDSSILPTAIVSEFARRHVTVCLSGDGGDELFGGYWRYLAHGFRDRYDALPALLRTGAIEPLMRAVSSSKSSALANRVRQFRKLLRTNTDDSLARHVGWSQILSPEAGEILRERDSHDPVLERLRAATTDWDPADPLNRILAFDLQYSLPCDMLHKVDLASMYHSLEVRVPFLDPDVVAAAMSLPSTMKIGRYDGKVILKEAYQGFLPDEILLRDKKGFEVPIGEFLRNELRDMFCDVVSRPVVESFELLDYDAVCRVYDDHRTRRAEHADLLFALLSLCWWRQGEHSHGRQSLTSGHPR